MGHDYGYMHNMMGWSNWMGPWSWLVILVLLGILVWALAERRGSGLQHRSDSPVDHRISAMEILKKRYAKGEMSREEFEGKKEDISRN